MHNNVIRTLCLLSTASSLCLWSKVKVSSSIMQSVRTLTSYYIHRCVYLNLQRFGNIFTCTMSKKNLTIMTKCAIISNLFTHTKLSLQEMSDFRTDYQFKQVSQFSNYTKRMMSIIVLLFDDDTFCNVRVFLCISSLSSE